MGQRRPIGKPIQHHIRDGTYRRDRRGIRHLPCEIPVCPFELTPVGKQFFDDIAADTFKTGTITRMDGILLLLMAQSWELYVQSEWQIRDMRTLIEVPTSRGTFLRRNPAVRIRDSLAKEIDRGLRQYRPTPASRSKLES